MFVSIHEADLFEHSVQIQMPLLQHFQKDFKIVPLLVGPVLSEALEQRIAETVVRWSEGRKVLFLSSSDMSHYPDQQTAENVDRKTLKAVCKLNTETLERSLDESMSAGHGGLDTALCGEGAVRLMIRASVLAGAAKAVVLDYTNSGEISGDRSRVVGYGAVAVLK